MVKRAAGRSAGPYDPAVGEDVARVIGIAIGTTDHDVDAVAEAAADALGRRGWGPTPETWDAEGQYLHATVLDYGEHGRWLLVEELEEEPSLLWLAEALARTLGPLTAHELEVREETFENERGELAYACRHRSVAVEADGTLRDVVGALGEDEARRPHGDLHETAGHLLGVMVHEHARAPVGAPRDLDLHRPRPGPASTATSRGGT